MTDRLMMTVSGMYYIIAVIWLLSLMSISIALILSTVATLRLF